MLPEILAFAMLQIFLQIKATTYNLAYLKSVSVDSELDPVNLPRATATDGLVSFCDQIQDSGGDCYQNYFLKSFQSDGLNRGWLMIDMGGVYTINSMYISLQEQGSTTGVSSNGMEFRVGNNNLNAFDDNLNIICFTATADFASRWIKCPSLSGRYIFITKSALSINKQIALIELMVYAEYFIQQNYAKISLSHTSTGFTDLSFKTSESEMLKLENAIQDSNAISHCAIAGAFVSKVGLKVKLNSAVEINAVVIVPLIDSTEADIVQAIQLSAGQLIVQIIDQSSVVQSCTPNLNTSVLSQPEFDCGGIVSKQVIITNLDANPGRLSICSVGILSSHICSNTKFTSTYFDSSKYISTQLIPISTFNVRLFDIIQTQPSQIEKLTDSVSVAVDDNTAANYGTLKCGTRVPYMWDVDSSAQHDLTTSKIFGYTTELLTIKTLTSLLAGTYNFILQAQLQDYPQLGTFPQQTPFQVIVTWPLLYIEDLDGTTQSLVELNYKIGKDKLITKDLILIHDPSETSLVNFSPVMSLVSKDANFNEISIVQSQFDSCIAANNPVCVLLLTDASTFQMTITVFASQYQSPINMILYVKDQDSIIKLQTLDVKLTLVDQDIKLGKIIGISATTPNQQFQYIINSGAKSFPLSEIKLVPNNVYAAKQVQVSVSTDIEFEYVLGQSTITIQVNDTTLANQYINLKMTALEIGSSLSCDYSIVIHLIEFNTQNSTSSDLNEKNILKLDIPCPQEAKALEWSYMVSKVIYSDQQYSLYKFECPTLGNLFKVSKINHALQFQINTEVKLFITKGQCRLTLIDLKQIKTEIAVQVTTSCPPLTNSSAIGGGFNIAYPPFIKKFTVSNTGLVTILFNTTMFVYFNPNWLTQTTQGISPLQFTSKPGSQDQDQHNLNITGFEVVSFVQSTLTVQIQFQTPQYISQQLLYDKLKLQINDPAFFLSSQYILIAENTVVETKIPRQITGKQLRVQLGMLITVIMYTMASLSLLNSSFGQYLMNQLLGMAYIIQPVLHYMLIRLIIPANLIEFFAQLYPLITFNLIPTDGLYQSIFDIQSIDDDPFSDQFKQVGYGDKLTVNNLQSLLIYVLIIPVLILLIALVDLLIDVYLVDYQSKLIKYFKSKRDQIIWNAVVGFYYNNYLVLSMIGFISTRDLRFGLNYTVTERFCSSLGIMLCLFSILFPSCYYISMYYLHYQAEKQAKIYGNTAQIFNFRIRKFGGLLAEYNIDKCKEQAFIFPLIKMFGKLGIVISVILLDFIPGITVLVVNYLVVIELGFVITIQPYKSITDYRIQIFNLITQLGLTFLLLFFTNYGVQEVSEQAGNLYLIVTISNICINILFGLLPLVTQVKRKFRTKVLIYRRNIQAKIQEQRIQQQELVQAQKRSETLLLVPKNNILKPFNADRQQLSDAYVAIFNNPDFNLDGYKQQQSKVQFVVYNLPKRNRFKVMIEKIKRESLHPRYTRTKNINLTASYHSIIIDSFEEQTQPQPLQINQQKQVQRNQLNAEQSQALLLDATQYIQNHSLVPAVLSQSKTNDKRDMTKVTNWDRKLEYAFMSVRGYIYWQYECDAYLAYLKTRIVLTQWDYRPYFDNRRFYTICKTAYFQRRDLLNRVNQKPSQIRQMMINFQVNEVRMEVAQKALKNWADVDIETKQELESEIRIVRESLKRQRLFK